MSGCRVWQSPSAPTNRLATSPGSGCRVGPSAPHRVTRRRRSSITRTSGACCCGCAPRPGDARPRLLRCGDDRPRSPPSRCGRAPSDATPGGPAGPGVQGVVYRSRNSGRLDRHPGAWRDGLCRGDGRCTTFARRVHCADLSGTNGIQANDLVGRKLARDRGEAAAALLAEMRGTVATLGQARSTDLAAIARPLQDGLMALETATSFLVEAEAAQA